MVYLYLFSEIQEKYLYKRLSRVFNERLLKELHHVSKKLGVGLR